MANNILKNSLEVTYKDFLQPIFGNRSKPEKRALMTLFGAIVTGQSTLVSDLSKGLCRDSSSAESKRTRELVSGWLGSYDFVNVLNDWLLKSVQSVSSDDQTYAIDFSDISKEFGGDGMEGMAMGWDGSRGVTAMGHDFVCASLVGSAYREARPVYVKLAMGRRSKGELLKETINAIVKATKGHGWMVEDRGMDDASHVADIAHTGMRCAIRVKKMDRDVFGDGTTINAGLERLQFVEKCLRVHSGVRKVQLRWRLGVVQCCKEPNKKDANTENVPVLVIESRFDGKSIWIYAICSEADFKDTRHLESIALRAAQAYCDRWQIETSFQVVKQEFALEKARVRTFKRLENIFSLCMLAYVYVTSFLRHVKGYRKILKFLSDNLEVVSSKTHALLAGIRALVKEHTIRFISGRPRKIPSIDDRQMLLDL